MQKGLVALLVVLAASAGTAWAEEEKAASKGATPRVKVYDFSGDTIKGALIQPDGSVITLPGSAKHSSLIRIRTSFLSEVLRLAEDL